MVNEITSQFDQNGLTRFCPQMMLLCDLNDFITFAFDGIYTDKSGICTGKYLVNMGESSFMYLPWIPGVTARSLRNFSFGVSYFTYGGFGNSQTRLVNTRRRVCMLWVRTNRHCITFD